MIFITIILILRKFYSIRENMIYVLDEGTRCIRRIVYLKQKNDVSVVNIRYTPCFRKKHPLILLAIS